MKRLSIIVPFLNEAANLARLHASIGEVSTQLPGFTTELVLVDDGSTDESTDVIRALPPSRVDVRMVKLSRNFGSHAALAAGVEHSTGDVLTFLSADMQDPPELVIKLLEKWAEGNDIVWGMREGRDDPWSVRMFAGAYYSLLRRYALPQMPANGVDFCLVDRRVVRSLGNLQERNSNIFNLIMWAGYRQAFVPYERTNRTAGVSKWTFAKRTKLFIDSFVAFSFLPMRAISAIGGLVSVTGMLYAIIIIARLAAYGSPVQGWASLMVAVLLLAGVQLTVLGVLSEYIWRSMDASRNRPVYIVAEVENQQQHGRTNTPVVVSLLEPTALRSIGK